MTDIFEQEYKKAPHHTRHESASGVRISPGPYVGIVKNNTDPLRSGKLQVWIAELGGSPTDEGSWKTVSYCTPFYGVTNNRDNSGYDHHPHSYGMWFVPPDIGVKVLCTFANGNPFDGYWFGCIPEWPNMYNMPGLAGALDGSIPAPVTNGYTDNLTPGTLSNIGPLKDQNGNNIRIAHDYQKKIWDKQNLTNDPDRGPGTSSAFRETPSSVFGISTPGQPINPNDPQFFTNKNGDQEYGVSGRKGGHTLVMDDGDANVKNAMFRLRSANGHMILMNDTKDFIYIINSKGTAWVEINAAGDINVYAQSNLNIEAKGGMQLETQGALKLHGKTVDIVSDGAFNMQGTDINILGSGSTKVTGKSSLHLKGMNTYLTGDSCIQIKSDGHIDLKGACHTINTADANKATEASGASQPSNMPTAEPWTGHNSPTAPTSQPAYGQQQGLPPSNGSNSTSAGQFGAANNFGSSNVQQSYGPMTNNIPPVTYSNYGYNSAGAGSIAGSYTDLNSTPGTSYLVSGAIAGAVAGIVFGSGASFDVSDISTGSSNPKYSTGEAQNNPGNLPYNNSDSYAVGFANGLAVYTKPESGIAALAKLFQGYNTSTSVTCIDLITKFLNAQSSSDPNVINMTRYMQTNLGINSKDHVALTDPTTLLGWVSTVIKYVQGRLIYTYDQIVSGCAISLNESNTTFLNGLQPITQPWQNNGGTNQYSGFVNPATTPSVANKGSSPLQQIANRVITNLVGGAAFGVGNAIGQALNGQQQTGGGSYGFVDSPVNNIGTTAGQTAYTNYLGQSVGSGQCVALVQAASGVGNTSTWVPGNSVLNGTTQPGTVIACGFTGPGGTYANQSGESHAAIFLGYQYDTNGNISGIRVQDQWAGQPCGTRTISIDQAKAEGAQNFSEVTHDGSTAIQAAGSPQVVTQNQIDQINGNSPTYSSQSQNVSGSSPTSESNAYNYDNTGYRDLSATGTTGPVPLPPSNPSVISANSPTASNGTIAYNGGATASDNVAASVPNYPVTPQGANPADIAGGGFGAPSSGSGGVAYQQITSLQGLQRVYDPTTDSYNFIGKTSNGSTVSISQSTVDQLTIQGQDKASLNEIGVDGLYQIQQNNAAATSSTDYSGVVNQGVSSTPTPSTDYVPLDTGIAAQQHNYANDTSYLYDTTARRDPISSPDAAAYGDKYSATVVNAPTNTPTNIAANPGDIASGGYGTGDNQSSTGSVVGTKSPSTNTAQATSNPGDLAGGGFGSGSSGGTTSVAPITGNQPAPATGGQTGAQSTPSGSASTGAAGKSC